MKLRVQKSVPWQVITIVVVSITLIFAFAMSRITFAAGEVFSSPVPKEAYETQQIAITDLQVNGTGDDQLNMNLYVDGGSLDFSDSTGLTFTGPTSGAELQFSGTRAAINAALSNLRYVSQTPGEFTVEATLGGGDGDVYNPANGHVYQVVQVNGEGIDWMGAQAAATAASYNGTSGYLATITSQAEQDFILDRINQDGWIGANDSAVEGEWRWVTGPETGMLFWNGNGETGTVAGNAYENWNQSDGSVEPNNGGGTEDCAEIRFSDDTNGEWNDRDCEAYNMAYVIEYGQDDDLPSVASTQVDITVIEAPEPAFTALSPADNSSVQSAQDLTVTYNQPMTVSELYFYVYNAADDSVVAELWTGETEDGHTFTYHLEEPLDPGDYYVTISDSGMEGVVDYYHGFDDKTTWNFTVIENGGISPETEDAAPNNGDANNDGIQDSTQANVASYVNPVTNKYVALEVDDACSITSVQSVSESTTNGDANYAYPVGLLDFVLDCGVDGFTTTIKQYYYDAEIGEYIVRKFNPNTNIYTTISSAAVEMQTIGASSVIVASYEVTDGGELDLDGQVNGTIVDPAGIALDTAGSVVIPSAGVPNTGEKSQDLIGFLTAGAAGIFLVGLAAIGARKLAKKTI